jgi:mitogen-activated protein kinase 1/3
MLNLNHTKRITVAEALTHPFLESMHDPSEEPEFEGRMDFEFESNREIDLEGVKSLMMREISTYN